MKFKLDENLGRRGREILGTAGHDVSTVADQRIETIADSELIERCQAEKRCLITLDLGFANPLTFLPSRYAGIAVLLAGQRICCRSFKPRANPGRRRRKGRNRGQTLDCRNWSCARLSRRILINHNEILDRSDFERGQFTSVALSMMISQTSRTT